jgi:hypothetical protein
MVYYLRKLRSKHLKQHQRKLEVGMNLNTHPVNRFEMVKWCFVLVAMVVGSSAQQSLLDGKNYSLRDVDSLYQSKAAEWVISATDHLEIASFPDPFRQIYLENPEMEKAKYFARMQREKELNDLRGPCSPFYEGLVPHRQRGRDRPTYRFDGKGSSTQ